MSIIILLMLYQHNQSTLLGGMRRSVYYPPDGMGRDSYIRTDNGGTNAAFKCQGVPELGNYMKFGPIVNKSYRPSSSTKYHKYTSDGSGRDKYVVAGHGGQYNESDPNGVLLIKFRQTLRDGGWQRASQFTNTSPGFIRPSTAKAHREQVRAQSMNCQRLSQSKKHNDNYLRKLEELRKVFHNK